MSHLYLTRLALGLSLAAGLFITPAASQQSVGVQIQPSIIEERVEPTAIFNRELRITNKGTATESFYISKRRITGNSADGSIELSQFAEENPLEITSWIELEQDSVVVPAGKTAQIPLRITIPEKAPPGGHFAAIVVTTEPPQIQGTGASVAFGAATIISLRVAGTAVEEADIREFRTTQSVYDSPEASFIIRAENTGNVLVRPRGPLEITDWFGKKVATLIANDSAAAIFPGAVREFVLEWKGEGLAFGRYDVVLSLGFGDTEKKTISQTLSFWVLPINIILPVILSLLALVAGIFVFIRFSVARKMRALGLESKRPIHRSASSARLILITISVLTLTLLLLIVVVLFLG